MKPRSFLWGAALFAVGISARSSRADIPAALPGLLAQWHDGRLIRDLTALHLEGISPDQSWAVAKFNPSPQSPVFEAVGVTIDGKTGQVVKKPGERQYTQATETGTIEPIVTLSGTTPTPVQFKIQYEFKVRMSGGDEAYSLFQSGGGGTAIFRMKDGARGQDQFSPATLIPDEWAAFAAPALKFIGGNQTLFNPNNVGDHRSELFGLLTNPNPLIAITAGHVLSDAHLLHAAFVSGPLVKATGMEQSAFVFLFLEQSPGSARIEMGDVPVTSQKLTQAASQVTDNEIEVKALGNWIDHAENAQTLKNIAVGLTALLHSRQSTLLVETRVGSLLKRIVQRQKALGTKTAADVYIAELPDVMALGT